MSVWCVVHVMWFRLTTGMSVWCVVHVMWFRMTLQTCLWCAEWDSLCDVLPMWPAEWDSVCDVLPMWPAEWDSLYDVLPIGCAEWDSLYDVLPMGCAEWDSLCDVLPMGCAEWDSLCDVLPMGCAEWDSFCDVLGRRLCRAGGGVHQASLPLASSVACLYWVLTSPTSLQYDWQVQDTPTHPVLDQWAYIDWGQGLLNVNFHLWLYDRSQNVALCCDDNLFVCCCRLYGAMRDVRGIDPQRRCANALALLS